MFDDIIPPLGEGRILNELASCKNSGEGGLGEVYNVLEEVSGIAQGTTEFCFPKESKTYPNPVLQKEGTRESRHAELDSASHDIPSPVLRTPSAWLLAKNGNSAFCRRASGSLQKCSSLGSQSAPKGRGDKLLCATPTSKSTKSLPTSTGRATCVKHIPAPFKSSPTFTGRATCVAHDKNLSTQRLNVLETDKNPLPSPPPLERGQS